MRIFCCVSEWRYGKRGLVSLLLVSLTIKVALLFSYGAINPDGVRFVEAAQQFTNGEFQKSLTIEKMPLYPILIAVFYSMIRDWVLAAQLISLLATVFTLVPLYLLAKDLFDEKVAFWTGLAFVLSPMLNRHAVDLVRGPLFLFLVALSVYFFWKALKSSRYIFFGLTSVSAVFASLCRIEGGFLFAVFSLALLVEAIRNPQERKCLVQGIAALVGLPLVCGLMVGGVFTKFAGKELTSFFRYGEILEYLQAMKNGDFLSMYHYLYAHLKAYENPRYVWATGSIAETARHYIPVIYLISLAEALAKNLYLLYALPLIVGFRKRFAFNRGHWLMLSLAGTYFLVAYYFLFTHDFISKRYVLVPTLLLFPWVGRGLQRIWAWTVNCRSPRIAMVLFLLFFCAVPTYKSLRDVFRPAKDEVLKLAGQWLGRQSDFQGAVIAGSDPRIRFYASSDLKFLNDQESLFLTRDSKNMERVAIKKGVDLMIVEISQKKRDRLPQFKQFSLVKEFVGYKKDVLLFRKKIDSDGS